MDYKNEITELPEPWKSFSLDNIFAAHFEGYPKEYIIIKKVIEDNIKEPTIDLASNSLIISPYLWEVQSGKKREEIEDILDSTKLITDESYLRYSLRKRAKDNIQIELVNHKAYVRALKLNAKHYKFSKEKFNSNLQRRIEGLELMKNQIEAKKWPNMFVVTPQMGEVIKDKDVSYSINPRWETNVLINESKGKNSGVIFYFPSENIQSKKRFIQRWHEVKEEYAKARTDWPSGLSNARDIPLFQDDIIDFNIQSIKIIQKILSELKQEMMGKKIVKPKVFLSYSHKDESLKEDLEDHLSGLVSSGRIEAWNDRKILPGKPWDDSIKKSLDDSDIVLFLLSPSFMNSGYIRDVEIAKTIERHKNKKAVIVPIILRACDFSSLDEIAKFQALPKDAKPITIWDDKDVAFLDAVKGLKKVIDNLDSYLV